MTDADQLAALLCKVVDVARALEAERDQLRADLAAERERVERLRAVARAAGQEPWLDTSDAVCAALDALHLGDYVSRSVTSPPSTRRCRR